MSTLKKDLIRTSFYAFRGSHRSVPDAAYVAIDKRIVFDGNDHNATYTAPADSYLVAQVKNSGATQPIALTIRKDNLDWVNSTGQNSWICGSLPVRKGETVKLIGSSGNSPTLSVYLRIYPYIGETLGWGG